MAKSKFSCQSCGHQSVQWLGKCPSCAEWNTFVEELEESSVANKGERSSSLIQKISQNKSRTKQNLGNTKPKALNKIESTETIKLSTKIQELDRVLGGGLVDGSFSLIGGEPGIGKSTLLLQTLGILSEKKKVLYVSGEESVEQIKYRADRLKVRSENLFVVSETEWEKIILMVEELDPDVLAIDSIQTAFTNEITSAPGSVSQVREVGARLMHLAKKTGIAVFLIGHVTKEGTIAGPRVLEHMVDTVLYFESVGGHSFRLLRAIKNRFGSTNEIGVFEMASTGLVEVKNPSELFLQERPNGSPGSVVVSSVEGNRPLLVELQALVSKSSLGNPRRTVLGIDSNRASLLIAVLEKKIGLQLYDKDVYINVVGGLELKEPSADLGIIAAIISSFRNTPLDAKAVFFGEVGLTGEVRSVSKIEERLKESQSLGFKRAYLPKRNLKKTKEFNMEIVAIDSLQDLIDKI
ncbi:MAG: DNA repair protein RadA [Oligoflexia bacterium]|nr:DNA repair protein RadA [Oligoflexia bacterium]